MNTEIIDQKFFKDADNNVFCIDIMPMNKDTWRYEIRENWNAISKKEAGAILNPPPTPEQLQQNAEHEKRYLLRAAKEKIDICQDAVDLNIATDAEKSALTEWRKYRVLLNRVDCTTAPDVKWPEQPK
ncbi:tail fiber assembly protein [Xenorhabdus sp. XENO-7]|uniref:Tail fiber assembly protein n=1 Tax=Xenorhabdus aichiensis TaxID=3025874 RepID=A0ABT5M6T6_9GAMM|nr:tail fiber assembly protein [Xenorhabdus aichiensis]MDC9622770.1 tail fiber assembly protein [Xenorhabdus aichiensis]